MSRSEYWAAKWQAFKCPVDRRPRLGMGRAIWRSLLGCPTDFYPLIQGADKAAQTLSTDAILEELGRETKNWKGIETGDGKALNGAICLARQSLDEVKAQTEYQDQKAGRLLTVSTILSAIAGLLFQRFNDAYPVHATLHSLSWGSLFVVASGYLAFGAFVFAVLCGALVTFHATRTRFKYENTEAADGGSPKSRLFYNPILRVRPSVWAASFVDADAEEKTALVVNPALPQLYLGDLVGETYLVAAKTADKIRYLEEAQRLFAWALRFLLTWLVMLALVSISVLPPASDPKPTQVQIVPQPGTSRPSFVQIAQRRPLQVSATIVRPSEPASVRKTAGEKGVAK